MTEGKGCNCNELNAFAFERPCGLDAQEAANKVFLFQFFCWGEIQSVLDEEPWIFDKSVMALKEIADQI